MVAPSLEAEWVRNHVHLVKYVSLVPSRIGEVYVELDILQRHEVPHSPIHKSIYIIQYYISMLYIIQYYMYICGQIRGDVMMGHATLN